MEDHVLIPELAADIREIYRSGGSQAESLVESHLESRLQGLTPGEGLRILNRLQSEFVPAAKGRHSPDIKSPLGEEVCTKIFSLLLGKKIQQKDLSSSDLLEKLAASLKTVFDGVNELRNATSAALLSEASSDRTIRHVIGLHFRKENQVDSLDKHLGQIKVAIRSSHEAYQDAFASKLREILLELSPGRIEEKCGKSIRFGPLRKAELFDEYLSTFERMRTWLESGKFMEEFMTEFQGALQRRLSSKKGGAG